MSAGLWVVTICMALLAFSFVATPLARKKYRVGLIGIAATMSVSSALLYWFTGSPDVTSASGTTNSPLQVGQNASAQGNKAVGSVASMVDGLAERLKQNPDDGKNWILLARSYKHLNRIPEAQDAYAKAAALGEYDAGLAALSHSQNAESINPAQIFGQVQLAPQSKDTVQPTDTVFVFARAVGGPPMPVAVLQRPVTDLPLDFLLNDSQAITPETKLSNYERVVVTARISRSGVATDALKNLEARSDEIVVADNTHLNLIIK